MATVILLNPMGSDVTLFMPYLMRGELMAGNTLYTLPYNNTSGAANIAHGVDLLHTKLMATSGDIIVFGYSEGCQIAYKWLRDHGVSTPISPSRIVFKLIGNAERKYGGFAYKQDVFRSVADVDGLPEDTPYTVIDFAQQYDAVADFPTAQPIKDAMTSVSGIGFGNNYLEQALKSVAAVFSNGSLFNAMSNAVLGLAVIHNFYFSPSFNDPTNIIYTEGNVTYMWCITDPMPLVWSWSWWPERMQSEDNRLRPIVEGSYHRPVSLNGGPVVSPSRKLELDGIEETCDKLKLGEG